MIKTFEQYRDDPYNEENWDDGEIIVIYLRRSHTFGFSVRKARMENQGRATLFYDKNGKLLLESWYVIRINNVDEEIELSDQMKNSTDAIVLPIGTNKEDIDKIISRVYERIYPQYKKYYEDTIKIRERYLKKISNVENLTIWDEDF